MDTALILNSTSISLLFMSTFLRMKIFHTISVIDMIMGMITTIITKKITHRFMLIIRITTQSHTICTIQNHIISRMKILSMDTMIITTAQCTSSQSNIMMDEQYVSSLQAIAVALDIPFLSMVQNHMEDTSIPYARKTSNQVAAVFVHQFALTACSLNMCTILEMHVSSRSHKRMNTFRIGITTEITLYFNSFDPKKNNP